MLMNTCPDGGSYTIIPESCLYEAPNWLDMQYTYGNKVYELGRDGVKTRHISAEPKKIIFNYPATIVYWDDRTKTVVKCDEFDIYDPIQGVLYCIAKKYFGNDNTFNKKLREINEALDEIEDYINVQIDLEK